MHEDAFDIDLRTSKSKRKAAIKVFDKSNKDELRRAFILSEIIGDPKSFKF